MNTRDCWFCEDAVRTAPPGFGWSYEDARWRAGHALAPYGRAGTVIVESPRGPRYLVDSFAEKAGWPVRYAREAAARISDDLEVRR